MSRKPVKFRDDIEPENTWVISDTHFGHSNIVDFCHRPTHHESVMIEEWAREVPEEATVLHLGDLNYSHNAMFKNVHSKHLPGARKLLIQGNHDHQRFSFYKQCGFRLVMPFSIPYGQHVVSFSHYPWNPDEEGRQRVKDVRIHGHIHNNGYTRHKYVPFLRNHINISVEQTKYRPVNLKLLLDGYLYGQLPEPLDL